MGLEWSTRSELTMIILKLCFICCTNMYDVIINIRIEVQSEHSLIRRYGVAIGKHKQAIFKGPIGKNRQMFLGYAQ
jgi:hypothetical protein